MGGAGARSSEEETVSRTRGKGKERMVRSPPRPIQPVVIFAAVPGRNSAAFSKAAGVVGARNTASPQSELVIKNDASAASGPAVCRPTTVVGGGGDDDAETLIGASSSGASSAEVVFLAGDDSRWPGEQRQDDASGGRVGLARFVGNRDRGRKTITGIVACGLIVGGDDVEGEGSDSPAATEGAAEVNNASDDQNPSSRCFRVCHPYFLGGAVRRTERGSGWGNG